MPRRNKADNARYMREYRRRNPERARAAVQRAIATNHEKYREQQRDYRLRCVFGFSAAEYDALLDKQGGNCAICRRPPTVAHRVKRRLAVDHCHRTGRVRGLLCTQCNVMVGVLEHQNAQQARTYLAQNT